MRFRPVFAALAGFVLSAPLPAADIVLAVHGGAGTMPRAELSAEREAAVRADLTRALRAGHAVIAQGGSSLDAVTRAIVVLEDSPYFNAGKGAVFNHDGVNELDASIMDGATRRAGAVAGLHRIRNPVLLARAVMEKSPHVMMAGEGAEAFAKSIGFEFVDPAYFRTEERWQQLQMALAAEKAQASATLPATAYFGTVGAVARDAKGQLAAATSTGGMTNKRWGRIGDAPVIGAGTYASAQCAVSATGWGEFYIRAAVAHDICARMAYRGDSVRAAAEEVVLKVVPALGGDGGVIALDASGRVAMPFNTEGMYRGTIDADGKVRTAIYRDGD
ncbi:MAG TPA: isoaspartyl peptidase/L-asparaginase [Pseudomonadota bacterium]|nr:isoaspartyl peptidase/L-asparaginase [Xanthomonadales bacterium]MBP6692199.1 isoaspartyl peptidase/L-asparaginase [Xanthomonadales bacterium]MBP8176795.1 isoaspartyl peptidase/L-asparaginase [Xanthomonadales bacterium]HRA37905.1 isoaspartyl peptidase/L-asparaginase [Pseudomonadota bacterium]